MDNSNHNFVAVKWFMSAKTIDVQIYDRRKKEDKETWDLNSMLYVNQILSSAKSKEKLEHFLVKED